MKNSKSVLLVDDDKDDQEFFVEALGKIKNAVLFDIVNNGEEALKRLERSEVLPSIIFMDVNMPLMDGFECLAEILKNPQISSIPVVFLSTDGNHITLAKKLGASAFIKKTADSERFCSQIELMISMDFQIDNNAALETFKADPAGSGTF